MRVRKAPRPVPVGNPVLFGSAEEAWFWYIRCQKARADGGRFIKAANETVRPCDPDDIYRLVKSLAIRRQLSRPHLKVLNFYGNREQPPDPRCDDEVEPWRLWDQALARMTVGLKAKEIIE